MVEPTKAINKVPQAALESGQDQFEESKLGEKQSSKDSNIIYKPRTHYSQNALQRALNSRKIDPLDKRKHILGQLNAQGRPSSFQTFSRMPKVKVKGEKDEISQLLSKQMKSMTMDISNKLNFKNANGLKIMRTLSYDYSSEQVEEVSDDSSSDDSDESEEDDSEDESIDGADQKLMQEQEQKMLQKINQQQIDKQKEAKEKKKKDRSGDASGEITVSKSYFPTPGDNTNGDLIQLVDHNMVCLVQACT